MKTFYSLILFLLLNVISFLSLANVKNINDSVSCQDKYDSLFNDFQKNLYDDNNKAIEISKLLISTAESCNNPELIVQAHISMGGMCQ